MINVEPIQHLKQQKYITGHPLSGLCYILTEAYYHFNGKRGTPHYVRWEGVNHWYLVVNGKIVDFTADQFKETPDYSLGRGCGFLTKSPSLRAKEILMRYHEVFKCA